MRKKRLNAFEEIVALDNLFSAWKEFVVGKRRKLDVLEFNEHLARSIFGLHDELKDSRYRHGGYFAFNINDPKPRNIHKASVRDRLVHHAIYRILYPFFDKKFITDSYSCRNQKGTHKALRQFSAHASQVSLNNTRTCWVLKCDIKKFFANIDHKILLAVLAKYIEDERLLNLLENVIESFQSTTGKGLPLGNLTSQLLVNVYMNEFDQFVKHKLKVKYYVRYADDFVFLSEDRKKLEEILREVSEFLSQQLNLSLHPNKIHLTTFASGVDFLGWVHFPIHRVLRTAAKRRMFAKLKQKQSHASAQSYVGLLKHGNAYKLTQRVVELKDSLSA
jgi:RNA-directed DNA polymerase